MKIIRKNTRFLFILILPVYFFIVQSTLLNIHTHVSKNGLIIVHSHPVSSKNGEPINKHHHSNVEICIYSQIHFDYYNIPPSIQIWFSDAVDSHEFFIYNESFLNSSGFHTKTLRGPPVFQIS